MEIKKQEKSEVIKRFVSKGVFPYQWAFTLLIPLRNIFLSPKQLAERLELEKTMQVMEVGAGPGYFQQKNCRRITSGKIGFGRYSAGNAGLC